MSKKLPTPISAEDDQVGAINETPKSKIGTIIATHETTTPTLFAVSVPMNLLYHKIPCGKTPLKSTLPLWKKIL